MPVKFVVVCALFAAAANAGHLVAPIGYTQYHNVAIANPSVDAVGSTQQNVVRSFAGTASQYSKAVDTPYSSVRKDDTRINNNVYTPAYTKTVQYAAPVYSGPHYSAPVFSAQAYTTYHEPATYQAPASYEAPSYSGSNPAAYAHFDASTPAPYTQESSSPSPADYSVKETTTTTEAATTESTSAVAAATEETTSALRSSESESKPNPATYRYESTTAGYRYDAPSESSYKLTSGVPSILEYASPAHPELHRHAPAAAFVKYAVPAPTVVKYAAPVQTLFKYAAPQAAVVKYSPSAVSSGYGNDVVKYAAPAAFTQYGAPAPAVYTQYNSPSQTTYTQYRATAPAPASIAYTKYGAPEPSLNYNALTAAPDTTPIEESAEIKNEESPPSTSQAPEVYQAPATYQAPIAVYQHQPPVQSLSNEHNSWSSAGAVSHVSFNGFGTHYVY